MNKIYFDKEAQKLIKKGVNLIANTVKSTLGPKGEYVGIYKNYGVQHTTKDGVSVAKEVDSDDPIVSFAIKTVREAAEKSGVKVGDGTTTATLLTQSIYNNALEISKVKGSSKIGVLRGINKIVTRLVEELDKNTKKITVKDKKLLTTVATISANNHTETGKLVAEVIANVGKDGLVIVEESQSIGLQVEYTEGFKIDQGYISHYFANNQLRMQSYLEDAYVLVTDYKISVINPLLKLIEQIVQSNKPLVIIADDVEGQALTNLVHNHMNQVIKVCCVKAPSFGDYKKEILTDIATLCGTKVISDTFGMKLDESITLEDLGRVRKFVSDRSNTLFVDGAGDAKAVQKRANQIKDLLENETSEYEKKILQDRHARLTGGVAIIRVGASSELETKEIKDRLDDAIHATKAALDGGITAGGGATYLRLTSLLKTIELEKDEIHAKDIMEEALQAPLLQILENAGYSIDRIIKIKRRLIVKPTDGNKNPNITYNVIIDSFGDYIDVGVIDPTKVIKYALLNSASVATQLLMTKNIIINKDQIDNAN